MFPEVKRKLNWLNNIFSQRIVPNATSWLPYTKCETNFKEETWRRTRTKNTSYEEVLRLQLLRDEGSFGDEGDRRKECLLTPSWMDKQKRRLEETPQSDASPKKSRVEPSLVAPSGGMKIKHRRL